MDFLSLDELLDRLNRRDECSRIEAKAGSKLGKSCMETVGAFANTPGIGVGYIVFGIERDDEAEVPFYKVSGVQSPDSLQNDLVSQCRTTFNEPVRVNVRVESKDDKSIVVAEVFEASKHHKPIYFRSKGVPKGVLLRVGSSDQRVTDEELAQLYRERDVEAFDETAVRGTRADQDISATALDLYRQVRSAVGTPPSVDRELLYSLYCLRDNREDAPLTVAGLLLFGTGTALRRQMPAARIDYIRVEGRRWNPQAKDRYTTVEIREPLLLAVQRLVNLILEDIPKRFFLPEGQIFREEIPLIPKAVLREAIVNAVMHRCYRTKRPIQVIRYSGRIEIENPGYSLKPLEDLGRPGSVIRNEKIAAVLHETNLAETKGTGIRAMRDSMLTANLTAPVLHSDRDANLFRAIFFVVNFLQDTDIKWLGRYSQHALSQDEARVLVIARELGKVNNADVRAVCGLDTLAASRLLTGLRDSGLLEQRARGPATHYILSEELIEAWNQSLPEGSDRTLATASFEQLELGSNDLNLGSKVENLGSSERDLGSKDLDLGSKGELAASAPGTLDSSDFAIGTLGKRASLEKWEKALSRLLASGPMTRAELSHATGRTERQLRSILSKMVALGLIQPTLADNPNSPHQAYKLSEEP